MKSVEIDPAVIVNMAAEIYDSLKKVGLMQQLGNDFENITRRISKVSTENLLEAYSSYIGAGMSREEAFELVRLRHVLALTNRKALAVEMSQVVKNALEKVRVE